MAGISIETSIIEFITFDGALKCMVAAKTLPMIRMSLICNGEQGEQVDRFNYLGSVVLEYARCEVEMRRRILIAKKIFGYMKKILANRKLSINTRKRLIKIYVWSTLLCTGQTLGRSRLRWKEDWRRLRCGCGEG